MTTPHKHIKKTCNVGESIFEVDVELQTYEGEDTMYPWLYLKGYDRSNGFVNANIVYPWFSSDDLRKMGIALIDIAGEVDRKIEDHKNATEKTVTVTEIK